ncbi:MAG: rod-binding protein [Hyphomonadaceae bacterium]|nr:rod-binding protein [Hyphomonadaceae bacterium]
MDLAAAAAAFPPAFAGDANAAEARLRRGAAASGAPTPPAQASEETRRLAEEFEAMALAQMLQPMFASIDPRGLGGGGAGEEMFRPMLVQEYAGAMARAGGIGLADAVVRELMRLQTVPPAEDPNGAHR